MDSNANWNRDTLQLERAIFQFSPEAQSEIILYMDQMKSYEHIDQHVVAIDRLPNLCEELKLFRKEVDEGQRFVILDTVPGLDENGIEALHWIISNLLGQTIVQNEEGRHLIHIYDRNPLKKIKDGARYHQTHETGQIHTDNVNIPEDYQYLLVGCVARAYLGGENILVSGQAVYEHLAQYAPQELEILMEDFWWEYRGISKELFKAPIIKLQNDGTPIIRHLRTYMESAHQRAKEPMSYEQIRAVDTLDAVLNMSKFQLNYLLAPGQILVANDFQILHDRKCFVDSIDGITFQEMKSGKAGVLKRTLLRTWVRKH